MDQKFSGVIRLAQQTDLEIFVVITLFLTILQSLILQPLIKYRL